MATRPPLGLLRRPREGLLLGGLILALAAAVLAEALPQSLPDGLVVAHRAIALPHLGHAALVPADTEGWRETALARPLFALDRRPQPLAAGADGSLPRLSGTMRFAQTALAIFDVPAADDPAHAPAKSLVLGVGAIVAGWTIEEIADERVLLTKGGEVQSLQLAYAKSAALPTPIARSAATLRILHGKKSNVFWQP